MSCVFTSQQVHIRTDYIYFPSLLTKPYLPGLVHFALGLQRGAAFPPPNFDHNNSSPCFWLFVTLFSYFWKNGYLFSLN